jgi:LEA14-like dessication related protein
MNNTLKYGIISVVLIAIVSVGVWLKKQTDLLKQTCIKLGKIAPTKLGINETILSVPISIKNLSNVNIIIKKQKYTLFLNDNFISEIQNTDVIELTPNEKRVIEFSASFSPKDTIRNVVGDFLFAFNDMILAVKIEVTFKLAIIDWTIKYTYKDKVSNLAKGISQPTEGTQNPQCKDI